MKPSVTQTGLRLGAMLVLAVLGTIWLWPKPAAPDVAFQVIGEGRVTLAQLRGAPVLVVFWATTCATCVAEMPELIALYRRHQVRGFKVVAVAMPYDPPSYVARFARERSLPFKVAIDVQGDAVRAFDDVAGTPTAFLIDAGGRIVDRTVGRSDFKALDSWLQAQS